MASRDAAAKAQVASVRIEDAGRILVGQKAVDALREDARAQVGSALADASRMWETVDLLNVDSVRQLRARIDAASAAVDALVHLTPVPADV